MNKGVVIFGVLGLALVLFFVYRFFKVPSQVYSPISVSPYANEGKFTTADHQAYPFTANSPARTDTSNQPWFNNNRSQVISPNGINLLGVDINELASGMNSVNDIIKSGTSIFDSISGWFSNSDAPSSYWADSGSNYTDWGSFV